MAGSAGRSSGRRLPFHRRTERELFGLSRWTVVRGGLAETILGKTSAFIKRLLPKEERFHVLLEKDTENLQRAARLFTEICRSQGVAERQKMVAELSALEHEGDLITGQVFVALNASFITPFDREDIQALAMNLDDILDNLEGAAQYLVLFELNEIPDALRQFADILLEMTEEVGKATSLVWNLSNEGAVRNIIVQVSALENRADDLYNTVISDLFKDERRSPLEVMKWKEVYQGLEQACDACRSYSNILASVILKNA